MTMNNSEYWVLKGIEANDAELIFDEKEFSIQRNLKLYWMNILVSLCVSFTFINTLINAFSKQNPFLIILSLSFIIILLIFLVYLTIKLFRIRKRNQRIYQYSDIKTVIIETNSYRAWLVIEFNDKTKDKLSTIRNSYFGSFIEILTKQSIDIKEYNKR